MVYTSLENSKIKEIIKLNNKKYRDISNLFLVEGEHLVLESYNSGYLEELILEENENFKLDIKTSYVSKNILKHISTLSTPSKIIGICKKKNDKIAGNKILALDNIQDPGNLGTIIRSAVAFNIDTILISENTVDLYNPKVIRATQGLIFKINIAICNLEEKLMELKKNNYKILATKVNGGNELKSIEKLEKFAIIMGNEGNGVSDDLMKMSDQFLYIKMNENCESLNVGVATSIILYQLDK